MPRFAANLSMLYNEHDFLDRFAAAGADGFKGVEFLFPYAYSSAELAQRLSDNGLEQVLFNAPPGDWDKGERGLVCLPGREAEFRDGFLRALEYAQALSCPRIHVMAGLMPADVERDVLAATYIDNLQWAAAEAQTAGRQILLEPINQRDMPGFFLSRQSDAHALVEAIGSPHVQVQMDLYHCQVTEGDLTKKIRQYLPTGKVGHFQIAGVPERHEPDVGELNYAYLFAVIDEVAAQCGWQGWIGCEYRPRRGAAVGATSAGLDWLKPMLQAG